MACAIPDTQVFLLSARKGRPSSSEQIASPTSLANIISGCETSIAQGLSVYSLAFRPHTFNVPPTPLLV